MAQPQLQLRLRLRLWLRVRLRWPRPSTSTMTLAGKVWPQLVLRQSRPNPTAASQQNANMVTGNWQLHSNWIWIENKTENEHERKKENYSYRRSPCAMTLQNAIRVHNQCVRHWVQLISAPKCITRHQLWLNNTRVCVCVSVLCKGWTNWMEPACTSKLSFLGPFGGYHRTNKLQQ